MEKSPMARRAAGPHRRRVTRIPKGRRIDVRREELDALIDLLNKRGEILNQIIREQEIQFQRIAQMQADLDVLKRTLAKAGLR
jgi:hypothetical protein